MRFTKKDSRNILNWTRSYDRSAAKHIFSVIKYDSLSRCDRPDRFVKDDHELGGRVITIGSDAHEPKYLTDQFSATCEMLQEIGFKYYAVYEKRQPEYFKLDTLL